MSDQKLYLCGFIFLLGASLGSFYHVVGIRLPQGQSLVKPSSHCTSCQQKLKAIDLLPVVSYIFLKGRCRYCGVKFSSLHVVVEVFTGMLFVQAFLIGRFTGELLIAWLLISLLVIITITDLLYTLILDKILLFFGGIFIVLRSVIPLMPWWDMFIGAFLGFAILLLLAFLSRGGMGGGDIKLYLVIGLVLGSKLTLLSLFLSAVIGLGAAVFLKRGFGQAIPFGPAIAAGSVISYFYGEKLVGSYFSLLIHLFTPI